MSSGGRAVWENSVAKTASRSPLDGPRVDVGPRDEQQPGAERRERLIGDSRLHAVGERGDQGVDDLEFLDHRGDSPAGRRRAVGGERVEREGFAEPQRHQPIAVPGDQEPGHRRRQRRDHEHGVRHLRPVLLLFELLVAQGRDGAIPRLAVEPGLRPANLSTSRDRS